MINRCERGDVEMLKYRGTYRVVYEMDMQTRKPCEFSFIPCRIKKGANIYRNNDKELYVYLPSGQIGNRLLKEYPDLFRLFLQSSCETILCFDEPRMSEAAKILKPWTSGKNIFPGSKRNIKFQNAGFKLNQHK